MAKRRDSRYEPGQRSGAWVKMRIAGGQEFVIAGYTPSPNSFDALLVGNCEGDKLNVAARVCSGFVPKTRETVFRHFKKLHSKKCPFANLPENKKGRCDEGPTDMKNCIWLKPELAAAFEYVEWAPANHLRHSKFIALREDKDPKQATRARLAGDGLHSDSINPERTVGEGDS